MELTFTQSLLSLFYSHYSMGIASIRTKREREREREGYKKKKKKREREREIYIYICKYNTLPRHAKKLMAYG